MYFLIEKTKFVLFIFFNQKEAACTEMITK